MKKYFEATTSDKDILKRDLIKQIVYKRAEELMVWKNAIPTQTMDALEIKLALPAVTRIDPSEVAEGALAPYSILEWFEKSDTMKKYQTRVMITDEAVARMLGDIQMQKSMEFAARGLAYAKDTDIKTVLAAGGVNSAAAGAYWNSEDAVIYQDIASGIEDIIDNTVMVGGEAMNLFYPKKLLPWLLRPMGEGFMPGQTIKGFVEDGYNITFYPTPQLTTSAMLVVNSPETAMHITYSGSAMMLSEEQRLPGVGYQYILTQLYKTFIMPESDGGTTSHRIYTITGVTT